LLRPLIAVVLVLVLGLPLFGIAFPALAQGIPLVGGFFEVFEDGWRDFAVFQGIATSADARVTGGPAGMTLTIEEVVFDGRTVHFAYRIDSEESLADVPMWEFLLMSNVNLRINRRLQNVGMMRNAAEYFQQVTDGVYIGLGFITFMDIDTERADLDFVLGQWRVRMPLERVETEVIIVNETVERYGFVTTVSRVNISPIGIVIHYEFNARNAGMTDLQPADFVRFIIVDDLGNEFIPGGTSQSTDYEIVGELEIPREMLDLNARQLTLIPQLWSFTPDGIVYDKLILGEIVINLP